MQPLAAILSLLFLAPTPSRPSEPANRPQIDRLPSDSPGGTLNVKITLSGTQPSQKGPAEWFTGSVRIDPLFKAEPPGRTAGALVTFEPCSRSDWHTHPLGKTLIVVSGVGRVQQWGGPVEKIRPGDVVWTPPNVKHWHGAAPKTAMSHIAIQEALDGKAVEWMEKVSDEQYVGEANP